LSVTKPVRVSTTNPQRSKRTDHEHIGRTIYIFSPTLRYDIITMSERIISGVAKKNNPGMQNLFPTLDEHLQALNSVAGVQVDGDGMAGIILEKISNIPRGNVQDEVSGDDIPGPLSDIGIYFNRVFDGRNSTFTSADLRNLLVKTFEGDDRVPTDVEHQNHFLCLAIEETIRRIKNPFVFQQMRDGPIERLLTAYRGLGFELDTYTFMFVRQSHPLISAKAPFTAETFNSFLMPMMRSECDDISRSLSEFRLGQNGDAWSEDVLIHNFKVLTSPLKVGLSSKSFPTFDGSYSAKMPEDSFAVRGWSKLSLLKAISKMEVDTGKRADLSLITGQSSHAGISLPGLLRPITDRNGDVLMIRNETGGGPSPNQTYMNARHKLGFRTRKNLSHIKSYPASYYALILSRLMNPTVSTPTSAPSTMPLTPTSPVVGSNRVVPPALLEFLLKGGLAQDYIQRAFNHRSHWNLKSSYDAVLTALLQNDILRAGFDQSKLTYKDLNDLKQIRDMAIVRGHLIRMMKEVFPNDLQQILPMKNDDIMNLVLKYISDPNTSSSPQAARLRELAAVTASLVKPHPTWEELGGLTITPPQEKPVQVPLPVVTQEVPLPIVQESAHEKWVGVVNNIFKQFSPMSLAVWLSLVKSNLTQTSQTKLDALIGIINTNPSMVPGLQSRSQPIDPQLKQILTDMILEVIQHPSKENMVNALGDPRVNAQNKE
jgi:hypothetical protein